MRTAHRLRVMSVVAAAVMALGHSGAAIAGHTNAETAVNSLLTAVKQSVGDPAMPPFARARITWLTKAQRAGALSIVLLRHTGSAGLDDEALMASGHVDGRLVIVIARAQFERLLEGSEGTSASFSRRQRNDFLLGLVHETVHLERDHPEGTASLEDRLCEEERAWRTVDVEVVRPLLARHEPMNQRFIEADAALRLCGTREPCHALRKLLMSSEINRP